MGRARRVAASLGALALASGALAAAPQVVDPEIVLLSPRSTEPSAARRPTIRVAIRSGRGPALLLLDGVDVTTLATREGELIAYRPDAALSPGSHRVKVVVADPEGRSEVEWTFTVLQRAAAGDGGDSLSVYSRGGLSLSGGRVLAGEDVKDRTTGTGNLGLTAGVAGGGAEASLSGNLGWFSTGPGPKVTPGGFAATVRRGQDSLVFGDVAFQGTTFTAPMLARRGLLLTIDHLNASLQAFQVASRSVRGLDAGVRFSDDADQLYGGAARTSFFENKRLQVTAAFLQGRSSGGSSFNTGAIDQPSQGRVAGLQVAGTLLGTSLQAEGGWSEHDPDTLDTTRAAKDGAASLRIARAFGPVSLSGAWERIGPGYASIASPSVTRDRQQLGLSAAASLGLASLSASFGRGNDNLGKDPSRPVVVNKSGGATLGLSPPGWPSLTLAWFHGILTAESVPDGSPGADSVTDTATGALSFSRASWTASLSSSLSWLDDRRPQVPATTTASYQLSVSARPWASVTFAPALARAETRSSGVARTADLAALSLSLGLVPRALTVTGQGSFASNRASDASSRAEQWNGVVRASWEIHRLLARWASLGNAILAASGRYGRVRDRGPQPQASEVWGVLLTLDLFVPLDARWEASP
ncbi:MAG: hypothetical protein HZB56_13220 [Deltaproteobacteria bacterium]|nr:hypothetical protein [Deltaproteobacteria bacterium]